MNGKLKHFFEYVSNAGFFRRGGNWGTPKKFKRYLDRLFTGVEVKEKRVLDVGAGVGVFSVYLALRGAASVDALEPEQAGSQKEMALGFRKMIDNLKILNVVLETKTFQQIMPTIRPYELLLLHNCINHFDEEACAKLHFSLEARNAYIDVFRSLNRIIKVGGQILLADCSRHNFFDYLGLKNPFGPSINWKIHQPPEIWMDLALEAGFECQSLRWTTFSHFGNWSQLFLANRAAAFFLSSHFSMVLRKIRDVE